jgi:hypothetical protein
MSLASAGKLAYAKELAETQDYEEFRRRGEVGLCEGSGEVTRKLQSLEA